MTTSTKLGPRKSRLSNGALIEKEGFYIALIEPPKSHKPHTGRYAGKRTKADTRVYDTHRADEIGGEYLWRCLRERNLAQFRNKPGFKSWRRGKTRDGWTKEFLEVERNRVSALVIEIMEDIKKAYPTEEDIVYASTACLMHIGQNESVPVAERVKALATVLTTYKRAAPSPRHEPLKVIDTTKDWLAAIGRDDGGADA